ncbi:MAG: molecular chaperone DnaJ [Parcubacteria group bacterium]|nr:molecular chaperone DnaJ [Parcubacteria group bacterium]
MPTRKDFYEILGIARDATKDGVKKAYHRLARKYHPDNKETGDEARFKEISEAYHTLSDDKRRAEYDAYGNVFAGAEGFSGFGPFGGAQGMEFDLGDIFGEFFGGLGGGERSRRMRRGRDITIDAEVSFAEAAFGTERSFLLGKTAQCEACRGTGAEPNTELAVCAACNGQGRVHETRSSFIGTFSSIRECDACRGEGRVPKETCHVCRGMGVVKKQEEVTITIPAGIEDGGVIKIGEMGEAVQRGASGDLYVKVHVARHPIFRREGHNLIMTLDIKLSDALLGATYQIGTLDGATLKLKIPAGVTFGEILRVKGKGVPIERGKRGDLLVKLNVNLPTALSRAAKELFEKLRSEGI